MNTLRNSSRLLPLLAVGALIAVLPAVTPPAARAQDNDTTPYSWQFQYKKGDVSKYRQNLTVTGQGPNGEAFNVEVKTIARQEVKDAADSGDATLVMTVESNDVQLNGQAVPDDPATHPVTTEVISRKGLLRKHDVANSPPEAEQIEQLVSILGNTPVPDQPVKINDTWKTELANPLVMDKKITMTSTLLGKEKVAGIDTLKIRAQVTVPPTADASDQDAVKLENVYYVDPKEGRIVRAELSADNVGPMKFKIKGAMNLIVPGVNDKEDAPKPDASGQK